MQTLSEYLSGRRKSDFAKEIGIRPDVLSQYLSGYRRPGYDLMLRIEAATGGAVPVRVWGHDPAHVGDLSPRQVSAPQKATSGLQVSGCGE